MTRKISRRSLFTQVLPSTAALGLMSTTAKSAEPTAFYHGVASGDPLQHSVIIWTRVTTSAKKIEVEWQLSKTQDFARPFKQGKVVTSAEQDYTVKTDVTKLDAGEQYFYRFIADKKASPVGVTRTLPSGSLDAFKLGVCSCSNFPAGYFHAYKAMAELGDLDVVVHLGDYIYEYDADGYASQQSRFLGRVSEPLNETVSLQDYRRRHAQYKTDKNLQQLHASVPFILSWDDHEFTNDAWLDGAQNHSETEGDWQQRKRDALKAYYEWMPIREPKLGDGFNQWRNFEIGNLASLTMLETRFAARDKQVDIAKEMVYQTISFDISDLQKPQRVSDAKSGTQIETYRLPFDISAKPKAISDYQTVKQLNQAKELPKHIAFFPDGKKFKTQVLDKKGRNLLGKEQREFVKNSLKQSVQSGKPWQLIGNQTLVSKIAMPNLASQLSDAEKQNLSDFIKPVLPWSQFGMPFGADSWNGYGAEREWFLNTAKQQQANMLVLTGDTHSAWVFDLAPESESLANWQAVELGTTSISSPGLPEALGINSNRFSELMLKANSNLRYNESAHRGFITLKLTPTSAQAEFHQVSDVAQPSFKTSVADRFKFTPSSQGLKIS